MLNRLWKLIFIPASTVLFMCRPAALIRTTYDPPSLKLFLSSSSPLLFFFWFLCKTVRTGDSIFIFWGFHVSVTHRLLTTIAQLEISLCQTMLDGDSLVENKALSLPKALSLWNFLKIFQDSTFQVINLGKIQIELWQRFCIPVKIVIQN